MTDIAISDLRAVRTASAVPSVLQVGPHQVDWISVAVAGRRIPVRGRVQAARLRPSFRFPCARVDRLRRRCGGDRAARAARDRTGEALQRIRPACHDGRDPARRPRRMAELPSSLGGARDRDHRPWPGSGLDRPCARALFLEIGRRDGRGRYLSSRLSRAKRVHDGVGLAARLVGSVADAACRVR